MREMWDCHGVSPTPKENQEIGLLPLFATGRVAQFAGGTWGLLPQGSVRLGPGRGADPGGGGKRTKGAFAGTEEIFVVKDTANVEPAADFARLAGRAGAPHLRREPGRHHPRPPEDGQGRLRPQRGESRPKNLQAFVRAPTPRRSPPTPATRTSQKAYNGAVAKWLGSPAEPTNTLTAQQALQEAQTEVQRVLDDWNKANPK